MTAAWCDQQRNFAKLEYERIEVELDKEISQAITARLKTNITVLDTVVGLFNASNEVSKEEFNSFFQTLNRRGDTLKGIQGVGYAAVVPNNNVRAFEQQVRASGQKDFEITPAGVRDLTTAIVYLEPNDWRNQRATGYDMYSQMTRRKAMQLAAITGEPALSGPVRLLQETNVRPQVGALVYQAIYWQPSKPFHSSEDRIRRLRGWAYSPLRMKDLIQGAVATIKNPALQGSGILIYDSDRNSSDNLLYDNQRLADSKRLTHPRWSELTIANRNWLIGIQLGHRGLSAAGWSQTLLLQALLGVSFSSLAAVISQRMLSNHLALRRSLILEQEASRERALATTVFDSSPIGIVVTDASGVIVRVNAAFSQLSGYSALEAKGHKTNLLRSDRHDKSFYEQMWTAILQQGYWNGEIWNRHRNGKIMRHELSITAVLDSQEQITNFVGLLRDVSERHNNEEKIRYLATHDQLTGLANRSLLLEELKRSLALAERQGSSVALMFIDLDNFKPVNDRWGHSTGDLLLKAVANRLQSAVRSSDTLCRQGGDEFVLLIPDAPPLEQLQLMARKLQTSLQQPFNDQAALPADVTISASIGIARWPDHAHNADGLMDAADSAMYQAKQQQAERIAIAASDSTAQ